MIKKQVIEHTPNTEGLKSNVVGVNQYYINQNIPTTYGTQNGNAHKIYEIKEDYEDSEQIRKKQVDDQTKFNARNPIEYQNELKVQELLELKAKQQLMNLCGAWDQQVRRRIALELDIIPLPLLGLFKFLIILTLMDLLWVTFSSLCMPVAGMHFVEDFITTNIRWQMFIYWCSNILQWICLTIMFAKLNIIVCRATIIAILINLAWHIGNFVFYFTSTSDRQNKFDISNPIIYWVESFLSFIILVTCIILYQRIDTFVKTNPDRALVLNQNMEDVIKQQYMMNNNNLPITQADNQQGGIVQALSQRYVQQMEQNPGQLSATAVNPSGSKNNFPISHRSIQVTQNANTYNKEYIKDNASRMNQSILNETDTQFLNQTNGNINYTGLYSQQFLDQDRSLIVDEIPNDKTAVLSIYHHDWRTHYGDFAPDQKKRKIIEPQMVKQLEDDLKQSRKMKMQGNVPQMYTYFDLHFVKQSPIRKNANIQQQMSQTQSPRRAQLSQLSPTNTQHQSINQSPKRMPNSPSYQEFDMVSMQNQSVQGNQQLRQQQNTINTQSPSRRNVQGDADRRASSKLIQLQQNFQDYSQPASYAQSPNIQAIKSRGQSLSFYGEASLGFNQKNKELSQQQDNQNQDHIITLQQSASLQGHSKTQNQFNNNQQQSGGNPIYTAQNFNRNSPKRAQSQMFQKESEDLESEYFKTKALVGDINTGKKKRWGNSTISKPQNIKTFDNMSNQ